MPPSFAPDSQSLQTLTPTPRIRRSNPCGAPCPVNLGRERAREKVVDDEASEQPSSDSLQRSPCVGHGSRRLRWRRRCYRSAGACYRCADSRCGDADTGADPNAASHHSDSRPRGHADAGAHGDAADHCPDGDGAACPGGRQRNRRTQGRPLHPGRGPRWLADAAQARRDARLRLPLRVAGNRPDHQPLVHRLDLVEHGLSEDVHLPVRAAPRGGRSRGVRPRGRPGMPNGAATPTPRSGR